MTPLPFRSSGHPGGNDAPERVAVVGPTPSSSSGPRARSSREPDRTCTYHAIFGRKGTGKTLLARELFKARARAGGSGIFVDPKSENRDLGTPVISVGALWSHVRGRLNVGRPFAVVYSPGTWDVGTNLEELWRVVWELGDLLLVIDETQTWASAERIEPGLQSLVGLARSRRIDMVFTMQTPPMLHKQIRGNLDVITSFRQPELDYAADLNRKWFNLPDPKLLQRLPKFHYLRSQLDRDPPVTRGRVSPPGRV